MDYLQYQIVKDVECNFLKGFKPYYKWITFNTSFRYLPPSVTSFTVLNLIINGLPSIHGRFNKAFGRIEDKF